MEKNDILGTISPAVLMELINSQFMPSMENLMSLCDQVDRVEAIRQFMQNKKKLGTSETEALIWELGRCVDGLEMYCSRISFLLMGSFLRMAPEDIKTQLLNQMKKE